MLCLAAVTVGLALAAAPAAKPPASPSARWSMAVLPLADRGVGKELTELVGETVAQEAQKLDGPRVIGMNEVKALLGFEAQRQVLGCEESNCVAEIAGALGVDKVLTGWVGKVGDSWLLTLKVVAVRTSAVEAQATERVSGGTGEEYLDLVGPMMERLFPAVPLKPGQTRGVGAGRAAGKPIITRSWAWAAAGVAVAAAGGGAIFGLSAKSAQDEYDDLLARSVTQPVSWAKIQDAADRAKSSAKLANILYVTGGVAGVGSAVLFLVTGGDAKPAAGRKPAVTVVPITGGALATLQGSF